MINQKVPGAYRHTIKHKCGHDSTLYTLKRITKQDVDRAKNQPCPECRRKEIMSTINEEVETLGK
jgi:predicted  nucleic acid-binding Zn ribbon protein